MTNKEFVEKALNIANNYKTLYVMGCFGAPMSDRNKKRYSNNYAYNRQPERQEMIKNASADTFGFDCVCLIKSILWRWSGDTSLIYGGATYKSNGVPDFGTESMLKHCTDVSSDFSNIEVGEVLYMYGHAGIYIGDGLAVECTPAWKNKVQITAVSNMGKKTGYNNRKWEKHGKLKFIEYIESPKPIEPIPSPTEKWTKGTYRLMVAKCIRKKHNLGNNIVKVKECTGDTKKILTSTNPNADAKIKVGTDVIISGIYNENGRIWGAFGNCWIVLCNIDGTPQAQKIT